MIESSPLHTRQPATPHRPDIRRSTGSAPQNLEFDPSVVPKHSLHTLVFRSLKRTNELFVSDYGKLPPEDEEAEKLATAIKAKDQYGPVMHLVQENEENEKKRTVPKQPTSSSKDAGSSGDNSQALVLASTEHPKVPPTVSSKGPSNAVVLASGSAIVPRRPPSMPKPQWHPPWKLKTVISGHTGWVRSLAVEPGNEWFASGSNDRIIKIWDLATGRLKLSLTGHISGVRGLAVSARHP